MEISESGLKTAVNEAVLINIPSPEFIENIKSALNNVFHVRADIDKIALQRGMPPFVLREIMSLNPLSVGIPEAYGGRGCKMEEIMELLVVTSYESLALSLTFGINMALFLQPVYKYGQPQVKKPIFDRFLNNQNMGGLMITEPGYGSDALNMQTYHTHNNRHYHLQGTKHWAGLTGWADYWLLTARQKNSSGLLGRDIDFFICDENSDGQRIRVEEVYENLGLYQIPYGRNKIDVQIPETQKLIPESTGIKMMLDLLHRSRMHIPGMALGFIQRMLDEATTHMRQRKIAGKSLIDFDQVQHRLATLQAYYTITSAACIRSCKVADIGNDISSQGFLANSVKGLITDMMQQAAQSATQLLGSMAYKLDNIVGRGIVDSRPFQIFEGSNDIMYAQISGSLLKMMKKAREGNLFQFLRNFDLTERSAPYLKDLLNFELDTNLPQRKMVELGQLLSRVVSFDMVIDMGEKGFSGSLIDNGLSILKQEISSIINSFHYPGKVNVVEDYQQNSSWLKFLNV